MPAVKTYYFRLFPDDSMKLAITALQKEKKKVKNKKAARPHL